MAIDTIVATVSGILAAIASAIEIIKEIKSYNWPKWLGKVLLWILGVTLVICILGLISYWWAWRLWYYGHIVVGPEVTRITVDGEPESSEKIKIRVGRYYTIEYDIGDEGFPPGQRRIQHHGDVINIPPKSE